MRAAAALAVVLAALAGGAVGQPAGRELSGSWTASGRRDTVPTGASGQAAVFSLSGAVVLSRGDGLSQGFQGVAVGFDDGQGAAVGRAVWTDEHGDQVWSRLTGETLAAGKRVSGVITGGTGRYLGVEGEYSFTWQYVVSAVPGEVQGRAGALTGHVRFPRDPR